MRTFILISKTTVRKITELLGRTPDLIKVNQGVHAALSGLANGQMATIIGGVPVYVDSTITGLRYFVDGVGHAYTISGSVDQPQNLNSDTNPPTNREADVSTWLDGRLTRGRG